MSAPILLLVVSGVVGGGLLFLSEKGKLSSWLAAATGLALGFFALAAPIDEAISVLGLPVKIDSVFTLLGRRLILGEQNRAVVGFLYLAAGFFFFGALATRTTRYLYSMGMVMVAFLAASLMVQPFLFAAIFLELAALAGAVVLVDPERPRWVGAQRLLTFYTIGMLSILISGWILEASAVTAGSPALVARVGRFLGLGFAVLLVVPPFHLWLAPAAEEGDSYSLSFTAVLLYSAGFFFLLQFFNEYEWLRSAPTIAAGVRLAGMVMIGAGSLWALAEQRLARVGAYVLLADLGASLVVVGSGEAAGFPLGLGISGARIVSLAVFALAVSLLVDRIGGERAEDMLGVGYTNPLISTTMFVGFLSLAGAPLTAGFPGRWGALQLLASRWPFVGLMLVLGIGVCSAAAFRWLTWFLTPSDPPPSTITLRPLERALQLGGIVLCVLLGLFPQLLYPWVTQTVLGLSNLIG